MPDIEFNKIKNDFQLADVEGKIDIYLETEGLTQTQYKELLRVFPMDELPRLEAALNG